MRCQFFLLLFFGLFLLSGWCTSEYGEFEGIVVDEVTGAPISGATLSLEGPSRTAISGEGAKYSFQELLPESVLAYASLENDDLTAVSDSQATANAQVAGNHDTTPPTDEAALEAAKGWLELLIAGDTAAMEAHSNIPFWHRGFNNSFIGDTEFRKACNELSESAESSEEFASMASCLTTWNVLLVKQIDYDFREGMMASIKDPATIERTYQSVGIFGSSEGKAALARLQKLSKSQKVVEVIRPSCEKLYILLLVGQVDSTPVVTSIIVGSEWTCE